MGGSATTLALRTADDRQRTVPRLVPDVFAVEALAGEGAVRADMIAGQAIEAFAYQVGRHCNTLKFWIDLNWLN